MPHQAPLQPGDPRRVGRYRIAGRLIGIPADGPVFIGTEPDGTEVSISVLRSDWTRDGAARDRFAAEAAVAKRVPPFCAARILDAGLDGQDAYLVSEYVPGRSLLEVVSADGVLDKDEVGRVAIGMATGLASVHTAGLVHGNFGPEYVIMTATGPRVVEFGITPPYGTATPSADMLAWARTVVFAAIGRPPASIADLDRLPDHARGLVEACLSPNPTERPAARAAVQELIGEDEMPAGVLAEGSRRSAPGSGPVPPHEPQHQPRQVIRPAPDAYADAAALYARPGQDHQWGAGAPLRSGPPSGPRRASGPAPVAVPRSASAPRPVADPHAGQSPGRARPGQSSGSRAASRHSRGTDDGNRSRQASSATSGRPVAHHVRTASRRRTAAIVGGAVVVLLAVAFVAVYLTGHGTGHGTGRPQAGKSQNASPASLRSPATKGTITPSAAATVSAVFAGTWSGQVQQPPDDTYSVSLTLSAGSSTGTVSYSTAGLASCSPKLTLTQAAAKKITLSQAAQGSCTAGTITMTLTGADTARYHFSGGGQDVTGTLTRS
jgi:hypothetical protein